MYIRSGKHHPPYPIVLDCGGRRDVRISISGQLGAQWCREFLWLCGVIVAPLHAKIVWRGCMPGITHIHTHTQINTHTHTHTHTYTDIHRDVHRLPDTPTHTRIYTHIHPVSHTHTHTHTHTRTSKKRHTLKHGRALTCIEKLHSYFR